MATPNLREKLVLVSLRETPFQVTMLKGAPWVLLCIIVLFMLTSGAWSQENVQDAVEKSAAKIEAFKAWLDTNGAKYDRLEFARVKGRGITALANTDMGRGYRLLYLPDELMITKNVIEASESAKYFEDESLTDITALWLLEQAHTPSSFWKPYIDILPKKLSLTLMWSEEELEALQATQLRSLSTRRKEAVQTKYRALFLAENQKKPLPDSLAWVKDVTEEEFTWALGTVWTRAFTSDQKMDVVLLPVEDMFGHMGPESVESNVRLRMLPNGVEFVSNTDISQGSLIEKFVVDSRPMTNAQLLFHYGFLFDHNPHDYVEVVSPYHPQLPLASVLRQILREAKCDLEIFKLRTGKDYADVLCAARIVTMTEEQLKSGPETQKAANRKALSAESERLAISAVKVLATRHLSFYSTTLELDDHLIAAHQSGEKSLPTNELRAVLIRRGEKQKWTNLLHAMENLESTLIASRQKDEL